jgi:hypothetical protein
MPKRGPVAAALVLMFAAGCAQGTTPTPSSQDAVSPTARPTAEPSPTPSAHPSSPGADFVLVKTIVERLSVRRGPGTDSERIGFLPLGSVGLVLSGPVDIGGVPWYQLTGMGLSNATGCLAPPPDQTIDCPGWHGWVAGADAAGAIWLEPAAPSCPQRPLTIETISETQPGLRLVCWSGQELTFRAWWPIIPAGAGLGGACGEIDLAVGWLLCQNINYNRLAANEAEGWSERLYLSVDPNSGVTMPERGQWVEVVGHFDDPAASLCAEGAQARDEDPAVTVFWCQVQFAPRSVAPVAGS